jgi:predicted CXXCH cytochrome family protein
MTFRLRTIDSTADGRQIVRDRDIAKPAITIGRASENDVHLPDLAIDPSHARMETRPDGTIAVTALGTLGFGVDGVAAAAASVDPGRGAELRFGSYNLTVSRDDDGTPLITVAQVASQDPGAAADEKQRFSLASALPGKRALSWLLGLVILGVFLAFPVLSQQHHQANPATTTVHGDKAWTVGPLSLAHHALEGRCEACHVKPFEAVRDTACLSCHKDVHDHADPARLALARGGGPLGERMLWAVAHVFGKPGPGACVDCHREHEGQTRMALPRQQFCADCHSGLKDRLTDTRLGNAGDFGTEHPQFVAGVVTDPFARRIARVSLDAHPRENMGLTFPHRLHLDPLGGVARMAASIGREHGYGRAGLQCGNCHHPTEDGVRFQPVNMERDCEACHSLAYDRVGGIVRTLRHGDVDQMIADLTAAGYHPPAAVERRRPGQFAVGGNYHINFAAPRYTSTTFQQALSRGGVCGECHKPVMRNGKPGVVPVIQVSRYMPDGWFDHKAHAQENAPRATRRKNRRPRPTCCCRASPSAVPAISARTAIRPRCLRAA